MKKVLIQSEQQLELVRQEIGISSQFSHPNLLPLLDHAIIAVKVVQICLWLTSILILRYKDLSSLVCLFL